MKKDEKIKKMKKGKKRKIITIRTVSKKITKNRAKILPDATQKRKNEKKKISVHRVLTSRRV